MFRRSSGRPASLGAFRALGTVLVMGITGLLPLLKPVTKDTHISELKGLVSFLSQNYNRRRAARSGSYKQ